MKSTIRIETLRRWLLLGTALLLLAGCEAPPSVLPLLDVTAAVLRDEADHLERDAVRAADRLDADRRALAAAFERDLAERDALDAAWVADAVSIYVAGREALSRQRHTLVAAYAARQDNLAAAVEANRRAVTLLEHHARLSPWPEGWDAWRLRDAMLGGRLQPAMMEEGARR